MSLKQYYLQKLNRSSKTILYDIIKNGIDNGIVRYYLKKIGNDNKISYNPNSWDEKLMLYIKIDNKNLEQIIMSLNELEEFINENGLTTSFFPINNEFDTIILEITKD